MILYLIGCLVAYAITPKISFCRILVVPLTLFSWIGVLMVVFAIVGAILMDALNVLLWYLSE